jgi:small subunit ribosomal protein S1
MEPNREPLETPPAAPEGEGAEAHPMDAFLEEEAYGMDSPKRGETRTGTIARISGNDILVDIGAKSEGVIPASEVEQMTEEQRAELVVGRELPVYIVRTGDRDFGIVLSASRAMEETDWTRAETLQTDQSVYEGTVAGYNKGGLIVKVGNLRGFIPASQISPSRRRRADGETPDKRWGKMVGETILAKVIEVDRKRNRLILSERAAAREARKALKERLIGELQAGEVRSGRVISLADFGAFVDIGGADGLVHLSEISWKRLGHPSEMLEVGQEVQVKVLAVDTDRKRISLSMRELEPDPWDELARKLHEGQLVEGVITKLTKFGAFASLTVDDGYQVEGLIHISELSDRRIEHPSEVVQEGQTVTLRVIKVDRARKRIGLSLKRVASAEYADMDWQSTVGRPPAPPPAPAAPAAPEVEDFDAELDEDFDEDFDEAGEPDDSGEEHEPA